MLTINEFSQVKTVSSINLISYVSGHEMVVSFFNKYIWKLMTFSFLVTLAVLWLIFNTFRGKNQDTMAKQLYMYVEMGLKSALSPINYNRQTISL